MNGEPQPHPDVAARIAGIEVRERTPLVICDADEVMFDFMSGYEAYLAGHGLFFTWEAFRLTGNVRRVSDGSPLLAAEVKSTVDAFFESHTEGLATIEGAVESLAAIATWAQVVVLTNLPLHCRPARERALARAGMPYAVVANLGSKGPAVRLLAERTAAPAYFIDDSPTHHADVARLAANVMRIHFVGHARLARLVGPAPDCHMRADAWPDIVAAIERDLALRGY